MPAVLRSFHPADLPGMYRVCLLTGDAGGDATARYRDPDLLGHVYVGPYPAADPSLSFVVRDDEGVAGYLVGTADTPGFAAWCEANWWPGLRARYPLAPDEPTAPDESAAPDEPAGARDRTARNDHPAGAIGEDPSSPARQTFPTGVCTRDRVLVAHLHHPPADPPPPGYPAHLHIDLLPRLQRQGWGRRLVEAFVEALRERGVPGLHLGVDPRNANARAFYARLGFTPADDDDPDRGPLTLVLPL